MQPKKGEVEETWIDPIGTIIVRAGLIVPGITLNVGFGPVTPPEATPMQPGSRVIGEGVGDIHWTHYPTIPVDAIAVNESGRVLTVELFAVQLGESSRVGCASVVTFGYCVLVCRPIGGE